MSEDKYLEEIRERTKKEQEEYNKYNKEFLTSWADRANIYKKVSSLVQPLFEKILDTVVDYCLEINKKEKSSTLMENTIDKMIDVLNDYCDATEEIEEIEERENNTNFYEDSKDVDIVEKDPKKFYLSEKSINEINSGDVNLNFKILNKTDINNLDEETKISKFTEIKYDESVFEYNINKCMDGSFMYICISGSNKDVFSSAELILYGLPNNKLKIIEHKKKENQNIIDLENIISHIFVDSDIYIIPEEKPNDNIYLDKIKSLEQLKEYFKNQGKDISDLDESIKYNKGWSDMFYGSCNKSEECKPTQKELSAINTVKQAAEETEQIIKDNVESEL